MIDVSIILPLYNVEKYVIKCLNSLKNQTLNSFEVIIVNDGSKDNSRYLCEKFIKDNDLNNFFIVDKENGGLSSARNYGLKFAKGKYVAFLDSDDYVNENTYELLLNALDENSIFVECGYYLTFENKEKTLNLNTFNNLEEYAAYGYVVAWNKLIKRDFLINNNIQFIEGLYYEDINFFYNLLEKIEDYNKIKHLNMPLIHYVQRNDSIMSDNTNKLLDIIKIYSSLNDNKLSLSIEYRASRNLNGAFLKKALKIKNKEIKKEVIKKYNDFLNKNFPSWKKNKFYRKNNLKDFLIIHIISKYSRVF